MDIHQLPTGTYTTRAAFAIRGGSIFDKRRFAATAVLVRHPRGDFLIDAGFGRGVASHVQSLPRLSRAPYDTTVTAREQLTGRGYDVSNLRGVLVTHCHWDHVSGIDDLDVPIWINALELDYAGANGDGGVFRAVSSGRRIHEYSMAGTAYLGFSSSLDVYGDGSIVIALAGGHTEGSVVVFVTVPSGCRYAFIGDLTWQLDGVRRGLERPALMRMVADSDPQQTKRGLATVMALAGSMDIIPAHDRDAYDGIPLWTGG
jgi:glyoxylase-like metal-dependent hydrolase (beta-lactamase superfamily II)